MEFELKQVLTVNILRNVLCYIFNVHVSAA